ncbi:MAG: ferrous iron transport protein B [Nanoarchaeota archaeon]|nr:ferrous iron transport protein B [Nanoarchaeota archaeon]
MTKTIRIALAGNPNCGKTTLFNNLTGMRQHVGNWPGKTVEKKDGTFTYKGTSINIIDLPGTYSLTAYSIEELIARDYIVDENPDIVINILDASNLERNLYLTIQLIELGANVVVALNMNKFANKKELKINAEKLSQLLGVPVIKVEAIDKTGKEELLKSIIKAHQEAKKARNKITYGAEIEEHITQLENIVKNSISIKKNLTPKWIALKLLEKDKQVIEKISMLKNGKDVLKKAEGIQKHLIQVFGEDVDAAIADSRYGFIAGLTAESVEKPRIDKITRSDYIDKVVTNRFLGIPIFLAVMYLMFQITFSVAAPLMGWIDGFFGFLAEHLTNIISALNGPEWLVSLVADGIIGGVGSVIIFLPNILLLFLIISFLEDSGYMARAAFIMDKVMHKIGLHGKSFIPMLLGFGCNVPAIMATRTLESKKDRILTILINPFMSCGARLPVYILFVSAFFTRNQGMVIFSLYLLGILVAIFMGLIFKKTLLKGLSSPFVMELPPYRLPTIKGTLIHMWERGKVFMIKAGTIIFSVVLVIWFLGSVPFGVEYGSEQSVIGMIGKAISPVFQPLGFGTWQASVALIFGVLAKEVVVGTLGTLYGVAEGGLGQVLAQTFTPLTAYAFMVFTLLYVPCAAALAAIKRETNSWGWMWFSAVYLTAVAWIGAFIVYQGGLLLGLG